MANLNFNTLESNVIAKEKRDEDTISMKNIERQLTNLNLYGMIMAY